MRKFSNIIKESKVTVDDINEFFLDFINDKFSISDLVSFKEVKIYNKNKIYFIYDINKRLEYLNDDNVVLFSQFINSLSETCDRWKLKYLIELKELKLNIITDISENIKKIMNALPPFDEINSSLINIKFSESNEEYIYDPNGNGEITIIIILEAMPDLTLRFRIGIRSIKIGNLKINEYVFYKYFKGVIEDYFKSIGVDGELIIGNSIHEIKYKIKNPL